MELRYQVILGVRPPHLHFEMWVNQQAVNPLTAKLPSSGGLTGKSVRIFSASKRNETTT